MIDSFRLTDGDRSNPLWHRIKAHLTDERAIALAKIIGNIEMTERETAAWRGRIKCLDGLIALGDARPVTESG